MSPYIIVFAYLFFITVVVWLISRGKVSKCFHRVDQAYMSMIQVQDKRFATVDQFSKLWESDQPADSEVFTKIEQLSKRLKDPALTKGQRNALHIKMDSLFGAAKLKMLGKKNSLTDQQLQFMLASVNEVEEQLSAARRSYYAAVAAYNESLDNGLVKLFVGSKYAPVDPYESHLPEILDLADLPDPELRDNDYFDDDYLKA